VQGFNVNIPHADVEIEIVLAVARRRLRANRRLRDEAQKESQFQRVRAHVCPLVHLQSFAGFKDFETAVIAMPHGILRPSRDSGNGVSRRLTQTLPVLALGFASGSGRAKRHGCMSGRDVPKLLKQANGN
jgi:hypothetical protein